MEGITGRLSFYETEGDYEDVASKTGRYGQ